ncbi:protein singed wings 2 isoform X2 [Bacillus rossius redtenbacheri]|uniref:protein singed wings 2 isoform X2 n=1 Tax=Bacillus rossius redtenbacheri TaxID=93214 RepID=UPI002FDDFD51
MPAAARLFHALVACAAAVAAGGTTNNIRLGVLPLAVGEDPCLPVASPPRGPACGLYRNSSSLVCSGGITSDHLSGSSQLRSLTLCHWPVPTFDPVVVATLFQQLEELSLVSSGVVRLLNGFPAMPRLQTLNLSGLHLHRLEDGVFSRLDNLRALDLSGNNLTHLGAEALAGMTSAGRVYLARNPWDCRGDLTWLVDDARNSSVARRVVDRDKTTCGDPQYRGKPLRPVMAIFKAMDDDCPRGPPSNCSCTVLHIVWEPGQRYLVPNIVVNCSHQGLDALPASLPANTTTLHVAGNQIRDVRPLAANPAYRTVVDVYLDGNSVESLEELEGSRWLAQFRALSLRSNGLARLPTYALDHALQRNRNALVLLLGGNPWTCDCVFTPAFQDLLMKYTDLVKDVGDVKCSSVEGDENSLLPIRELSRSAVCVPPSEYLIQPLDLLNAVLAALIVLVVGKLAYDYWTFKKTGKDLQPE